jgi:hypothetical protein
MILQYRVSRRISAAFFSPLLKHVQIIDRSFFSESAIQLNSYRLMVAGIRTKDIGENPLTLCIEDGFS